MALPAFDFFLAFPAELRFAALCGADFPGLVERDFDLAVFIVPLLLAFRAVEMLQPNAPFSAYEFRYR